MSDTPRTDEIERQVDLAWFGYPASNDRAFDKATKFRELARELERALSRYEQAEIPEYPPVIIDSLKAAGKAFNWPLIEQASYDALRAYAAKVTVELAAAKSAQREAETHLSKEIVRIALETDTQIAAATERAEKAAQDLDIEKACNVANFLPAPCGHPAQYCHSEDGGKNIQCYVCDLESAERRAEELQAKIDALMFEYCPDEMTPKQIAEWGVRQAVARNEEGKT